MTDPVLARRAQLDRLGRFGRTTGYSLLVVACAAFAVGAATSFTPAVVRVVVAALISSSLLLAPSIVLGYAVRAAARDDAATGEPAREDAEGPRDRRA